MEYYLIGGGSVLIAALLFVWLVVRRLARETEAARLGPTISDLVGLSIGTPDPTIPSDWVPEAAPASDRARRRNPLKYPGLRRDRPGKPGAAAGLGAMR